MRNTCFLLQTTSLTSLRILFTPDLEVTAFCKPLSFFFKLPKLRVRGVLTLFVFSFSAILRKNKANTLVKSITRPRDCQKKTKWMLPQISLDVVGYDGLVDHIRVQTRDGVGCYG